MLNRERKLVWYLGISTKGRATKVPPYRRVNLGDLEGGRAVNTLLDDRYVKLKRHSTNHQVIAVSFVNWPHHGTESAMASKFTRSGSLASALRPAKQAVPGRNAQFVRALSSTAPNLVVMPKDAQNMRQAPRDHIGELKAPIVNPADKYQSKADNMHRYGAWLMGCLPKYVQQFSVWKDELTIYIPPSGVIPVMAFLKCSYLPSRKILTSC